MHGLTGGQLKYGPISGNQGPGTPVPIDSSIQFRAQSGRFVFMSSGYANVCVASSTIVSGFMDCEEFLSSSTQGADLRSMIVGSDVIFRLPVNNGTFAVTNLGLAYDLRQDTVGGVTLIQGVDVSATSRKLVIVVGGDLTNNEWVDVIMNPSKRAA